jgi:hypothetical protein
MERLEMTPVSGGRRPPVFVLGTQRSGTTLLYQMLSSHPSIFMVNEFWHLYPHITGAVTDTARLEKLLTSHLSLPDSYTARSDVALEVPFDHVDAAFDYKLELTGKSRWGIKHPRLTYYLEHFRERYPEAKFIILVRDPRAVVNSYLSRQMNVANVFHGARLWREQVDIQMQFAERYPDHCLWLRFEELLTNPERELRRICTLLDEPFDDRMLRYYEQRPQTTVHEGNVNITKPIRPEIAERWKSNLSRRQIGIIEAIVADSLSNQGYRSSGFPLVRVSRAEKWMYDLHQVVMINLWWQKRSRWHGIRKRLPWASRDQ